MVVRHCGSLKFTIAGLVARSDCSQNLALPPWSTKPELSAKKPGSYSAAAGISASRDRSMTVER